MSTVHAEDRQMLSRVLTVGDSRLSADCLRIAVSSLPEIRVLDIAEPADAIAKAIRHHPDFMLIHLPSTWNMALELTSEASTRVANMKIILLGVPDGDCNYLYCVEAGASGWVAASASLDCLPDVISALARDEVVCSPRLTFLLFERLSQLAHENIALEENRSSCYLTARELEIVDLIAAGKNNDEIAAHLHISLSVVKRRVRKTLETMQISRSQLVTSPFL